MSITEQLDNTVANRQYDEHIASVNELSRCEKTENCQSSPRRTSRSTWNYLKCLFWTAVTGIFNCGHIVLDRPVTDPWPVPTAFEPDNELTTVTDCVSSAETYSVELLEENAYEKHVHADQFDDILVADIHETVEVNNLEKYCFAEEHFPEPPSKETPQLIQFEELLPIAINKTVEENPLQNHCTPVSFSTSPTLSDYPDGKLISDFDTTTALVSDSSLSNGLAGGLHVTHSSAFTLISAYYSDANNGLIDELTRDTFVEEILKSVIPRNLSDSSEVSVSPQIRKMYAWADPTEEDDSISKKQNIFDFESTSTNSDERLPYPGKLTMSDNSFSPLSPSTVESNTVMESSVESTDRNPCNDLNLPDINRQHNTLAWAMTNMRVEENAGESKSSSDRPPLPNSLTRQGRDKSPVSTANSVRLSDTQSVPAYMAYDGYRLFDEPLDVPKPKRSSSLKSQRTPPGTPGQKVVRFADALGLDLETVRHVFDHEAPPKIPASATFDLELDSDESIAKLGAKQFRLCFAQPGAAANFIRRVLDQTVCLEDAHVEMPRGVLIGTVRVKSLGFEKRVFVRVTYNDWSTYCDTSASYVQGSHDGVTDRFSFSLVFPDTMVPGRRVQFAIRYDAHTGEQFWDNNYGQNYSVVCYAKATDLAGDGSWVHYL